ncbi:MAG: amino acid adenylation domain-containing protein [Acidobacteria bacterium]|nr:amino acid adenylation domain-containing protein [Acidobacteriota bacterium]
MKAEKLSYQIASAQNKEAEKYWLEKFSGELNKSYFPYDFNKRAKNARSFEVIKTSLPAQTGAKLMELSKGTDARLFVIMTAAVSLLLDKYTHHHPCDITVGTSIYKQETDAEFINTILGIRTAGSVSMPFKEFLVRVGQAIFEAQQHQNYPLENVLRLLHLTTGEDDDFPLFDVGILFENLHNKQYLDRIHLNMIFIFRKTGQEIALKVEYNALLYKKATVERIISHFNHLLGSALFNANARLLDLDIFPGQDKQEILFHFNDTAETYDAAKTMHLLFEEQVERTPGNTAVICDGESLSYRELNETANCWARELRQKGVKPNHFVGVVMDRSIEMVMAVMAILKAGGAYVPLEPYLPDARIKMCLASLNVNWILTNRLQTNRVQEISKRLPSVAQVFCLDEKGETENECDPGMLGSAKNMENPAPAASALDIAYVIFTSGTTGVPKGVVEQHRPVINIIQWVNQTCAVNEADKLLFVASLSFDLSVYDIFGILSTGGSLRVVKSEDLSAPERLLEIIFAEGITFWDSAPAALMLLAPLIEELSHKTRYHNDTKLRLVFLSGDWIPVNLPDILKEAFEGVRVMALGGATEATIWSNFYPVGTVEPDWISIPYGKPIMNAKYYILDCYYKPCPIGVPGDLFIGGECLALGYINDVELSAYKFIRNPFVAVETIYRTGDMARWFPGGNMEFLGRIDNQVKIRGYRIELGEIESRLLAQPGVKEAIAVVRESETGDKYLCAYVVTGKEWTGPEMREALAKELPGYMIPSYFVPLERIPLTPNGKVDRRALPKPGLKADNYIAPRNQVESILANLWSQVLDIETEQIGVHANFFDMGGNSLLIMRLINKIKEELLIEVLVKEIFAYPTIEKITTIVIIPRLTGSHALGIKALCEKLGVTNNETAYGDEIYLNDPILPIEECEYYDISYQQKMLLVIDELNKEYYGFIIPKSLVIEGNLDKPALKKAFATVINRHESLRTSFIKIAGEYKQKISPDSAVNIEEIDLSEDSEQVNKVERCIAGVFTTPFNLRTNDLLRVKILHLSSAKHLLVASMHHIVSDYWSMEVFVKEIFALYNAYSENKPNPLKPLPVQYKDYTAWQNKFLSGTKNNPVREYWHTKLGHDIPVLALPTDYPRPSLITYNGDTVNLEIGKEKMAAFLAIANEEGINANLFMALNAVIKILLYKYTGQEDIIIGVPTAGRKNIELENQIGFYVNMLALRDEIKGSHSFTEILAKVKETNLDAYDHDAYPFDRLVEDLQPERDLSHSPIFDVMVSMNDFLNLPGEEQPGVFTKEKELKLMTYAPQSQRVASIHDLSFILNPRGGGGLFLNILYNTDLFMRERIEQLAGHIERIIDNVIENPAVIIDQINILMPKETQRLLVELNNTGCGYPENLRIHEQFERMTEKYPDYPALVKDGAVLSYRELNRRAGWLAGELTDRGIIPDDIAVIMSGRSLEMLVLILGVLKAGAGYLPVEPSYPEERIKFILKDSGAKYLLLAGTLSHEPYLDMGLEIIQLNNVTAKSITQNNNPNSACAGKSSDLAYIIYTSGSTGIPKGVMICHYNVIRLLFNEQPLFHFTPADTWTLFHSYGFDFSVWEMYGALLNGGKLVIVSMETAQDPKAFLKLLKKEKVTILNQTPGAFYNLVEEDEEQQHPGKELKLSYVIFGGEALSPGRLKSWQTKYPSTRLINMYGITETTVHVTYKEITGTEITRNISNIGVPIPTLSVLVLDKAWNLVPLGIPGELCVGGKGLARGYLNRPELTSEKFRPLIKEKNKSFAGVQGELFQKLPLVFYKTGDLVRRLFNGEIEYLGRIDSQVKIRGYRIELGEIEACLLTDESVKETVVVANTDKKGDNYICAYIVTSAELNTNVLRKHLLNVLPPYMVPSYFIRIGKIPLTANGKIDKKALPGLREAGVENTGCIAPQNDVEMKLLVIWQEVLEKENIGIDDDFFEIGGHSLKAFRITSAIHKEFNVEIGLDIFFSTPTIREIAKYIETAAISLYLSIPPVEKKSYYPLSSAQKRLYLIQQMDLQTTMYNMPETYVLQHEPDVKKLTGIFMKLIARHESLRTSFHVIKGETVQRIHNHVEFAIEYKDAREQATGETVKNFTRPFDLAKCPLLRVGIIAAGAGKYLFMIDMHHIISDGLSHEILVKDFLALYAGVELPSLNLQYKDFTCWQNNLIQSGEMKKQEDYWLKEFAGDIPELTIPLDYPRAAAADFTGESIDFKISAAQTAQLKKLAREVEATSFMLLLTIYSVLLAKLSMQEDIVIGIGIAGRRHPDLEKIIGMFVNTLALRCQPHGNKKFKTFLKESKDKILQAFQNQDYLFENLVEKVVKKRDLNRNPLFDTVFMFQNITAATEDTRIAASAPNAQLEKSNPGHTPHLDMFDTAKFDMFWGASEVNEQFFISVSYRKSLFKKETIERYINYFQDLFCRVLTHDDELDVAESLPLFPWNVDPKHRYVAIEPTGISGRRFVAEGRHTDS